MNVDTQFYMAKIAKMNERIDQLTKSQNDKYNDLYHFVINCQDPKADLLKNHFEKHIEKMNENGTNHEDIYKSPNLQKLYKDCAFILHPDKPTGSTADFQLLNLAYENGNIHKIIEIILEKGLPVEIPQTIKKSLKYQYEKAQRTKRSLKTNWTFQWNNEWTHEEKLAFISNLYIF